MDPFSHLIKEYNGMIYSAASNILIFVGGIVVGGISVAIILKSKL